MDRNLIELWKLRNPSRPVALRKESVDRNVNNAKINKHDGMSLSARRAWIEISTVIVILRKRNSRSPQGERG